MIHKIILRETRNQSTATAKRRGAAKGGKTRKRKNESILRNLVTGYF